MFLRNGYKHVSSSSFKVYHTQMDSDATTPQVVDAHYAANNISSKVIENQYFPYWLSILYDRYAFREEAIRIVFLVGTTSIIRKLVEFGNRIGRTWRGAHG